MNNPDMLIAVLTLAGAAVLLVTNWIRGDLVAVLVMLTLMLTGVLEPSDALSGLSSPVVVIIASMFVISEAIVHTGLAQRMGEAIIDRGGTSEVRLLVLLMTGSALVGSFMSSTATAAIFIPITLAVAEKAGLNHRRLLIPLAAAALISGMMTLVATTPNIVINNALRSQGQEALSFFSFTPFGLAVLVLAIGFMVVAGRHLLSGKQGGRHRRRERSIVEILEGYDIQQRVGTLTHQRRQRAAAAQVEVRVVLPGEADAAVGLDALLGDLNREIRNQRGGDAAPAPPRPARAPPR